MSRIKQVAILIGALLAIHYLATGKLPFGTPQLLQSDDGSESRVDE